MNRGLSLSFSIGKLSEVSDDLCVCAWNNTTRESGSVDEKRIPSCGPAGQYSNIELTLSLPQLIRARFPVAHTHTQRRETCTHTSWSTSRPLKRKRCLVECGRLSVWSSSAILLHRKKKGGKCASLWCWFNHEDDGLTAHKEEHDGSLVCGNGARPLRNVTWLPPLKTRRKIYAGHASSLPRLYANVKCIHTTKVYYNPALKNHLGNEKGVESP